MVDKKWPTFDESGEVTRNDAHRNLVDAPKQTFQQNLHKATAISKPSLIVIAGVPGTGKTTLAQNLHQLLGADSSLILDVDEQRRIFGVEVLGEDKAILDPRTNIDSAKYFAPEIVELLFKYMLDKAEKALKDGKSVLVTAPLLNPERRDRWQAVALDNKMPFTGIFLECSTPDLLIKRVDEREKTRHQSQSALRAIHFTQGDSKVLKEHFLGVSPGDFAPQWHQIDIAHLDPHMVAERALELLKKQLHSVKEGTKSGWARD